MGPPPLSTIHLGEDSVLFVGASIAFFGGVDQKLRKFWITVEGLDAFEYITVVKLICLPVTLTSSLINCGRPFGSFLLMILLSSSELENDNPSNSES